MALQGITDWSLCIQTLRSTFEVVTAGSKRPPQCALPVPFLAWTNPLLFSASQFGTLQARRSAVRIPARARDFFPPKRPHRLWGPPSLVFDGYRGTSPGVKWLGACISTTHLHILPMFKNEWRYASTTSLLPHDVDKDAFTFFVLHFYVRWKGQLSRNSDSLWAGRSGDRIAVGGRDFRTRPDRPWGPPIVYKGYGLFPVGKSGRDVALTTHPHLAPKLLTEL